MYVFQSVETYGSVFTYESITMSAVRSLALDSSPGINPQNFIKIVTAIFEKMDILKFFLCEVPLILRVARKRKKQAGDICKGTPDIKIEQD